MSPLHMPPILFLLVIDVIDLAELVVTTLTMASSMVIGLPPTSFSFDIFLQQFLLMGSSFPISPPTIGIYTAIGIFVSNRFTNKFECCYVLITTFDYFPLSNELNS